MDKDRIITRTWNDRDGNFQDRKWAPPPPPNPIVSEWNRYRVKEIGTGGTLVLENDKVIRFAGIEWADPEDPRIRKTLEEWVFDEEIILEFDQKPRDSKGRFLAYVHLVALPVEIKTKRFYPAQELFMNAALVDAGLAVPYPASPNLKHARVLEKVAEDSKNAVAARLPSGKTLYHRAGCTLVERLSQPYRTFSSPWRAEQAGRAPCGLCIPNASK